MAKYEESELIINPDGSIYHLSLKPDQLADTVILVGDPGRVSMISNKFEKIEHKITNREIATHTGIYNDKRMTVMSTGMGTDNLDIVINELDALANIDFTTREDKEIHKKLRLIRLGTSGALQPKTPINSFIIAEYGLGLDGLMNFYNVPAGILNHEMLESFIQHSKWPDCLPKPYLVKGSEKLLGLFDDRFLRGITATAPGFYGPQGRNIRLKNAYPDLNERLQSFRYNHLRILNFEMETSALYGLGSALGHDTLTACVAIANRSVKAYNPDYKMAVEAMVIQTLEKLSE